jgi:hypothetical protein
MNSESFHAAVLRWFESEPAVKSVVQHGSSAAETGGGSSVDAVNDHDFHVIAAPAAALECVDWPRLFPQYQFVFAAVRPATGGVRRTTAIFREGVVDVVVVPSRAARLAVFFLRSGLYRRFRPAEIALNEMATSLRSGYRFHKGEREWRPFYDRVAREMVGVRLSDAELKTLAAIALLDADWTLRKIECGELIAAQHMLHRNVSEFNLRLYRELRLRRGEPLPSFGLGRRAELLATPAELTALRVTARLDAAELRNATLHVAATLMRLMHEAVPAWIPPELTSQGLQPARAVSSSVSGSGAALRGQGAP